MSTSATIAVQHEDKTISSISVHWDGTLEYVGAVLKKFHSTQQRVETLIAGGNISSLGITTAKNPNENHIFVSIEGIKHNVQVHTSYLARDYEGVLNLNRYTDASDFINFIDNKIPKFEYVFTFIDGMWWYSVNDRTSFLEV